MDAMLPAGWSCSAEGAYSLPLAEPDPGHPKLFQTDAMQPRFAATEVAGEPRRVCSSFVKGHEALPARIPARL